MIKPASENSFPSLKNQLLIAMPSLQDPVFDHSVTLICEHNENGAVGIVINQPLDITTSELLDHLQLPHQDNQDQNPIYAGGPVQIDRGFVIHQNPEQWKSTIHLDNSVKITTSSDILMAIASRQLSESHLIALGYAGWSAGQLEQELADNSWLTTPMNTEILFNTEPPERWRKALALLGIDPDNLSHYSGHA